MKLNWSTKKLGEIRKEIKKEGCTGLYFYKIHTAGRLS